MGIFAIFKDMTNCSIGDGKTVTLWHDTWNDDIDKFTYPHLHSFALNKDIFERALAEDSIYNLFQLPLSIEARNELHNLQEEINDIELSSQPESWDFTWSNATFSTKNSYRALIGEHHPLEPILDIYMEDTQYSVTKNNCLVTDESEARY
jgi:hypothetical protein